MDVIIFAISLATYCNFVRNLSWDSNSIPGMFRTSAGITKAAVLVILRGPAPIVASARNI